MINLKKKDLAWRGFVAEDGSVIAWPTLLSDHNQFHRIFYTKDSNFGARWRQWDPSDAPDFEGKPTDKQRKAVEEFLNG